MGKLIWNRSGERFFEMGVDRGVLYPQGGPGVVWNGLVNVNETIAGAEVASHYYDGVKYLDVPSNEDFAGSIEAFTYPTEFEECDGTYTTQGLSILHQTKKMFGLSYRTKVGNDLEGPDYGYKIHLIYNATATVSDKGYATLSDSPEAMTFQWDFSTVPLPISGFKPTAHLIADSTRMPKSLIKRLEDVLYGSTDREPSLPDPSTLSQYVTSYIPTGYAELPYGDGQYGGTEENGEL